MTLDYISGDRRQGARYQYASEIRFSYSDAAGAQRTGYGVTADLGRGGIRFHAENPPSPGTDIEMRVAWPFLLQGTCPLELVVWGVVSDTTARGTVMRFRRYEFRTCGDRSFFETQCHSGASRVA